MDNAALIAFILSLVLNLFLGILTLKNEKYGQVLIIVLFLLCGYLGYFGVKDILDKDKSIEKLKQDINTVTRKSADSTTREIKEAVKTAEDSVRIAVVDSMKNGTERLSNEGKANRDSILNNTPKPKYTAVLDIMAADNYHKNPTATYSPKKDSVYIKISLKNLGNDIAHSLADEMIIIKYRKDNGVNFHLHKTHVFGKESILGTGNVFATLEFNTDFSRYGGTFFDDTTYVYLKIKYKNSEGKDMRPLRRIFYFFKDDMYDVVSEDFLRIEKDLKRNHYY